MIHTRFEKCVRYDAGFTLVELAIALAVGSILLALALPMFAESRANGQIRAAAAQLQQDLQWARAEAIKRNQRVGVEIATAANASGWTVFVDRNNSSTLDAGDLTLRQFGNAEFRARFGSNTALATNGAPNPPVFAPFGNLANVGNGTYGFTTTPTTQRWLLVVGTGGRIVTCIAQSPSSWACRL